MEGAARRGTEGERKFEQPACAARTACDRRCGAAARGAGAATLFTSVHSGVRGHQGLLQMRHDAGSPSGPSPGWIGAAGASSARRMAFHCVLVRNRQRPYTLSPKKRRPLVSCLARCALSPIPFPIQSRITVAARSATLRIRDKHASQLLQLFQRSAPKVRGKQRVVDRLTPQRWRHGIPSQRRPP